MNNRNRKSGFSLIEALFAAAVLGIIIVPATLAFHSHIASAIRIKDDFQAEITLENLYADAEQKLLFSEEDLTGFVNITAPIQQIVTEPESTPCGKTKLIRTSFTTKTGKTSKSGLFYCIRPAQNR